MKNYFNNLRHIPHFFIIRSVEVRLFLIYLSQADRPFLDLGCGDGHFGESLDLNDLYGIDIDETAIKRAGNKGYKELFVADASNLPFPNGFFSTVFSNCAVEHMDNLFIVLKQVQRVLKDKGTFIFTVPSSRFIGVIRQDPILMDIGLNSDDCIAAYNAFHHHVNILSLDEWKGILTRAGFSTKEHHYYLPGDIGSFVMRMDMLYSLGNPISKSVRTKSEKQYKSFFKGRSFRDICMQYIKSPQSNELGTHLLIKAEKV